MLRQFIIRCWLLMLGHSCFSHVDYSGLVVSLTHFMLNQVQSLLNRTSRLGIAPRTTTSYHAALQWLPTKATMIKVCFILAHTGVILNHGVDSLHPGKPSAVQHSSFSDRSLSYTAQNYYNRLLS